MSNDYSTSTVSGAAAHAAKFAAPYDKYADADPDCGIEIPEPDMEIHTEVKTINDLIVVLQSLTEWERKQEPTIWFDDEPYQLTAVGFLEHVHPDHSEIDEDFPLLIMKDD